MILDYLEFLELANVWDELAELYSSQASIIRTGEELKCKFADLK